MFIGCTPLWFFQTILALAVAAVFRLNKAATVTGAWLNLPWFAPFVYGVAIKIGVVLAPGLTEADTASIDTLLRDPRALSWSTVWSWLRGSSLPLLVGSTVVGTVAAVATYAIAFAALTRRRGARPPTPHDVRGRRVA